jgi:acetyl esterase/lipase
VDPERAILSRRTFLGGLAAGAVLLSACGGPDLKAVPALDRTRVAYGPLPDQEGDLTLPRSGGPWPVLVLIHGGYWKPGLDRSTLAPLGESLGRLGYAVWNIDYRTIGADGGGWTGTFDDVCTAIDHLATLAPTSGLDLQRVVAVGHSAGGHLALWSAVRARAAAAGLGTQPVVPVSAVLSFAGVPDLLTAGLAQGGGNAGDLRLAVHDLLGGSPADVPERYAAASPRQLLPLGVPQLLVHGGVDDRVPIEQAREYRTASTSMGDTTLMIEVPTGDHGDVTRPDHPAWPQVVSWLSDVTARSGPA